ncbi:hypothetical protein GCM10009565_64500 [Amycolatopsis albidoflavus]
MASWKQWPVVTIHCGATSAAEQKLEYVLPFGSGIPVMLSFAAKPNWPAGTSEPFATAKAGLAVRMGRRTAAEIAARTRILSLRPVPPADADELGLPR